MDIRYELIKKLGEGGQGRVVLVRDTRRRGILVALKRLGDDSRQQEELALEFDRLSRLRHPSLAAAYDFGRDDEGAYFTTEYIDGPPIATWAKTEKRDAVVRAMASLLRALALLHSRDLVHGDISPENVLISFSGTSDSGLSAALPKLLDLGGACRPGQVGQGSTAGYAAPEMLTGRGALPSSDLYAFGALLSEVLLGVRPFGKGDASSVVQRQLAGAPRLPDAALSPLATLLGDLLSPDPSRRPGSALKTLERLATATEVDLGLSLADLNPKALPSPQIVGREHETATLFGLIDQLTDGNEERVAVITGPPGSGRTTLLKEAVRHAQLQGLGVIGELQGPARADDLLGALVGLGEIGNLSPEAARALSPWRNGGGSAVNAPHDSWSSSVAFAAVEALTAASALKPMLVVVDDFSLSDKLVQEVVKAISRSLAPTRKSRPHAAVLVASDSNIAETIGDGVPGLSLSLRPLDATGVDQLVSSMLPGVSWPSELSKSIFLTSKGLPGSAEQLVRQAVGQGGERELKARIRGLVKSLPDEPRMLLAVMGKLDKPLDEGVIHRAGISPEAVFDLMGAGFLFDVCGGTACRVVAASEAAAAAFEIVDKDNAFSLARKIAEAVSESGDMETSARLFDLVGDKKRAAQAFGQLADRQLARGDFSGAGQWFEKALAESETGPEAATLARSAIRTWQAIGWHDQALAALPMADFAPVTAARMKAELIMEIGRHREALGVAMGMTAMNEGKSTFDALIAACECQLGNHERALAIVKQALAPGAPDQSGHEVARLAQTGGLACTYLGRVDEAYDWFSTAKQGFEEAEDLRGQLKVSANIGMLLRLRGNLVEARAAYDGAITLARAIGDRPREALHLMNRATISQVACHFKEAYRDYRQALDIATVLGHQFRMTQVEVNLSDLLLDMGDVAGSSEMAFRALKRCRAIGHDRLEVRALLTAGRTAQRSGALVRAERQLQEARRRFSAAGDEAGRVSADLQLVSLFISLGDLKRAQSCLATILEATAKKGRFRENARGFILLAEAKIQEGRDLNAALAHLDQAEHALKKEPSPEFLWRLELSRARVLKRLGRQDEATRAVKSAQVVFDDMLEKVPEQFRTRYIENVDAPELAPAPASPEGTKDRRVGDLEMLMEINQELTREHDPKRLLSLIMERAVELTGAERGMVVMPKGAALEQVICFQISDEIEMSFSRSVAEKVVAEGRSVLAVDALDDERFRAFVSVAAMKLRSILAVPLKIKRRVVGAIYLDSRLRTGVFTDADRRLLEAFGAQAAIALETARLISENSEQCRKLEQANGEVRSLTEKLQEKLENSEVKLRRVGALLEKTQKEASHELRARGVIGQSMAMQKVQKMIDRIALTDVSVYIYGASGTGKELAARAIHSGSERREKPFVPINCGALPPKLLASELFGHKKGAFTGAIGDRPGLFRLADKGTLFLDEVSDMDKEMQTHLLRVLQDGKLRSLGDSEEVSVDVRILSASNRDLEIEVEEGRFREDLFYRLNVVRIDVPPLSERREDIPLLVEFLVRRHAKTPLPVFTKEAIDVLMSAQWPGNVRELENEVQRAMAMAGVGQPIGPADLSPRFSNATSAESWAGDGSLRDRVSGFERLVIQRALVEQNDNATKAAANLGISRATLYKKLERYNIDR